MMRLKLSHWLAVALRLVCALYLLMLAVMLWRRQRRVDLCEITVRRVFLTTLSNPKGLVFAFVILPPQSHAELLPAGKFFLQADECGFDAVELDAPRAVEAEQPCTPHRSDQFHRSYRLVHGAAQVSVLHSVVAPKTRVAKFCSHNRLLIALGIPWPRRFILR